MGQEYCIASKMPGLSECYSFNSIKHAKKNFCNKIFSYSYASKDDFTRSSDDANNLGKILLKYSSENCYANRAFSNSINDNLKWADAKNLLDPDKIS